MPITPSKLLSIPPRVSGVRAPALSVSIEFFEGFLDLLRTNLDYMRKYERNNITAGIDRFLTSGENARKLLEAYQEGIENSSQFIKHKGEGLKDTHELTAVENYNFNKLNRLGKAYAMMTYEIDVFHLEYRYKKLEFLNQAFKEATQEVLDDYYRKMISQE